MCVFVCECVFCINIFEFINNIWFYTSFSSISFVSSPNSLSPILKTSGDEATDVLASLLLLVLLCRWILYSPYDRLIFGLVFNRDNVFPVDKPWDGDVECFTRSFKISVTII